MEPMPPPSPTGAPLGPARLSGGRLVLWILSAVPLCGLGGLGVLLTPLVMMGSAGCSGYKGCFEAWRLIALMYLALMAICTAGGLAGQWLLARRWAPQKALSWEPLAIVALSAAPLVAYVVLLVVGPLIENIFGVG